MEQRVLRSWIVIASAIGLLAPAAAAAQDKLAFVDMKRVVKESEEGKADLTQLKSKIDEKQKEFQKSREEINKMEQALAKEASGLKPEDVRARRTEIAKKIAAWQDGAGKYRV